MTEKNQMIQSIEKAIEISNNLAEEYSDNKEVLKVIEFYSTSLDLLLQEGTYLSNTYTFYIYKKLKETLKLSYNIHVSYIKNSEIKNNRMELMHYLEDIDVLNLKVLLKIMYIGISNDINTEYTLMSLFEESYKELVDYNKNLINLDIVDILGKDKNLYSYLENGYKILGIDTKK